MGKLIELKNCFIKGQPLKAALIVGYCFQDKKSIVDRRINNNAKSSKTKIIERLEPHHSIENKQGKTRYLGCAVYKILLK